jgi:hypothetical protein
VAFFAIHALAMVGQSNAADSCQLILHVSWPALHRFVCLALYLFFLFGVPDAFFDAFLWLSCCVSCFFLLLQGLFIVEVSFDLNVRLEDSASFLTVLTASLVGTFLGGYALSLYEFTAKADRIALILNCAISILLFASAAVIERGSIFTASVVGTYVCLLTVSGCASGDSSGAIETVLEWISLGVLVFWAVKASLTLVGQCTVCGCENSMFSLALFHCEFAVASAYLAMVVSGWDCGGGKNEFRRWINWLAACVTELLYGWTLVAPVLLPNRDFD